MSLQAGPTHRTWFALHENRYFAHFFIIITRTRTNTIPFANGYITSHIEHTIAVSALSASNIAFEKADGALHFRPV